MCSNVLFGFLFLSFALVCSAKKRTIVADEVNYITRKNLMNGLVLPREIYAVEGEEISFKISKPVKGQTQCFYRMPSGRDENILSPHKDKYELWIHH